MDDVRCAYGLPELPPEFIEGRRRVVVHLLRYYGECFTIPRPLASRIYTIPRPLKNIRPSASALNFRAAAQKFKTAVDWNEALWYTIPVLNFRASARNFKAET